MKIEKLNDKQLYALENIFIPNKHIEILFSGSSRAGKSVDIIWAMFMFMRLFPGLRSLVGRTKLIHARSSIWLQTILPMLKNNNWGTEYKVIDSNHEQRIIFANGSELWLGGFDNKERTDKVLGQDYAIIFLNEAVEISQSTRDIIKTRLAQKINGFRNFLIYDCNPRHPLHYLYQEFYVNPTEFHTHLDWSVYDNQDNVSKDYIDNVLGTLKGDKRKRFFEGVWASLPGSVYDVKAENIIEVNPKIEYYNDVSIGLDFGLYTAINLWGIKDKKAYCIWEIILQYRETTTKKIIQALNKKEEIKMYDIMIYGDHEPDRIQEIEEAGYMIQKAYKDVAAGDATVNEYELYFDRKCQNTFQSMLNLQHKQDAHENYIEAHVKENDHEADAARYALHSMKIANTGNISYFGKEII